MKHLSRFLCLLLMLALLLPGALAEAVEQTEQIDSGIEEDEVEKVGDIFDMYQVGSMVEANGKLYTISYGPTICEYDGENWRIAVVASSFSDVLRFSEDGSFYSDETSAVLSVDEDGTLLLLYPYSDGVIDLLRVPLDGSDVTRVHSFRLAEDSSDEDERLRLCDRLRHESRGDLRAESAVRAESQGRQRPQGDGGLHRHHPAAG